MTNPGRVFVVVGCLLSALLVSVDGRAAGAATVRAMAGPQHTVDVTGTGVATYPAFDPGTGRYAVTTTAATAGSLTVTTSSDDPAATVTVNGRPAAGGTTTLTDLTDGDEVAVWITDSAGTARYTYVYLPEGFPALERTTPAPAPGELAPGQVMLTLSNEWFVNPPDFFETVVDVNGVPSWVNARRGGRSIDLQKQPNGHYTVARLDYPATSAGDTYVELDEQFRFVRDIRTEGLVHTDGHDLIVQPDGTTWLMAYEPNSVTGKTDSVIQRIDPAGEVTFQWSSAGLESETTAAPDNPDYAHINSFEVLPDGDILASFRHFSSVFKIDTSTFAGSVEWKLGGRDSDFVIRDQDGVLDGGPCAQHTARLLPNGDVMVFDNGSGGFFANFCVDPNAPAGPLQGRPQTRVVTFSLDEGAGEATIVSSYAPAGRFAWFAGSSQPLPGAHTLVGWSSAAVDANHPEVVTELDETGEVIWQLANPQPSQKFFTYRAHKAVVPDATPPEVEVTVPAPGATYVEGAVVRASYGCSDRGGSSLQTCAGTSGNGAALDTTPGRHAVVVSATDGAGGTTTVPRTYTVLPASRPDAQVRPERSLRWTGDDRYGAGQQVSAALRRAGGSTIVQVRLQNDGARPDRFSYVIEGRARGFRVGVGGGGTTVVAPGASRRVGVRVTRRDAAQVGAQVLVRVRVRSTVSGRTDTVSARVVARR